MINNLIKLIFAILVIYTFISGYINRGKVEDVNTGEISAIVERTDVDYN